MTDYDQLAAFYDRVMGNRRDVVSLLKQQIKRHHPYTQSVLELGCGTGSIMRGLSKTYTVTGIDQSAKMLELAQQKLPNSRFKRGTIAGFKLKDRFDTVICVFDTINHLTNFADWQKLFSSTNLHLNDDGLFIFDMNTIGRMRALTAMPTYTQDFKNGTMDMYINGVAVDEVQWHVVVQSRQRDQTIQVYEEYVNERSFPLELVRQELEKHFIVIDSFDSDRKQPTDSSDRIYFVCRKA